MTDFKCWSASFRALRGAEEGGDSRRRHATKSRYATREQNEPDPPVKTVFINNGLAGIVGSQRVDSRGWEPVARSVDNSTRESRQISAGEKGGGDREVNQIRFLPSRPVHSLCNIHGGHATDNQAYNNRGPDLVERVLSEMTSSWIKLKRSLILFNCVTCLIRVVDEHCFALRDEKNRRMRLTDSNNW